METRDTADYEKSEAEAVKSGKAALAKAPWLFDRVDPRTKGFFVEVRRNEQIHPGYCSVHVVDGVGTKLYLTAWSGKYGLQSIDAVAMNANDMATVLHAYPDTVDLYFAVQSGVEENHMGEIMTGFVRAFERIRIPDAPFGLNVGKLETASLDEMISLGVPNKGWDVGVVMTGYIHDSKIPNLNPKPGNVIVGVSSTGLHSNGFTGARHVLFTPEVEYRDEWKSQYRGRFKFDDKPSILEGKTVLDSLQVPTALYLVEASLIGQQFDNKDIFGVNITGYGLHNFNRAGQGVSFEITDPLEPLPVHMLLAQESKWDQNKAYTKSNMGMGFAYIAPSREIAEGIVKLINDRDEHMAKIVGEVRANDSKELRTTLHKPFEGGSIDFVGYG